MKFRDHMKTAIKINSSCYQYMAYNKHSSRAASFRQETKRILPDRIKRILPDRENNGYSLTGTRKAWMLFFVLIPPFSRREYRAPDRIPQWRDDSPEDPPYPGGLSGPDSNRRRYLQWNRKTFMLLRSRVMWYRSRSIFLYMICLFETIFMFFHF